MVYVDTNVFVYPLIYGEEIRKVKIAKKILLQISKGEVDACTSSLTWDEFVWVLKKFKGMNVAKSEGRKFLQFPNLKILSVDGVLDGAQEIIEKYDVRPRDAIHIACALKNKEKELISDDEELDKVKEIRRIRLQESST